MNVLKGEGACTIVEAEASTSEGKMSVDLNDIERRMEGAVATLKTELNGLRTGRASAICWPIMVKPMVSKCPWRRLAQFRAGAAHVVSAGLG